MKRKLRFAIFLIFLLYLYPLYAGCEKAYERILLTGLVNYESSSSEQNNVIEKDWYHFYMDQTKIMLQIINESEHHFLDGEVTKKMYLELEKSISKSEIQSYVREINKSYKLCYKNKPIVLFKDFKLYLSIRIKLMPRKLRYSYIRR